MERITKVGKAKKFGRTLMEQNCKRKDIGYKMLKGLESFWCTVDKFTIVELLFNGKRYHGLSSKSDQDIESITEGVAHAYKRAFDEMVVDAGINDFNNTLREGLVNFRDACKRMVISPMMEESTIEIGTLLGGTPLMPLTGIHNIKCINCGERSVCDMRMLSSDTRCTKCGKGLISMSEK